MYSHLHIQPPVIWVCVRPCLQTTWPTWWRCSMSEEPAGGTLSTACSAPPSPHAEVSAHSPSVVIVWVVEWSVVGLNPSRQGFWVWKSVDYLEASTEQQASTYSILHLNARTGRVGPQLPQETQDSLETLALLIPNSPKNTPLTHLLYVVRPGTGRTTYSNC